MPGEDEQHPQAHDDEQRAEAERERAHPRRRHEAPASVKNAGSEHAADERGEDRDRHGQPQRRRCRESEQQRARPRRVPSPPASAARPSPGPASPSSTCPPAARRRSRRPRLTEPDGPRASGLRWKSRSIVERAAGTASGTKPAPMKSHDEVLPPQRLNSEQHAHRAAERDRRAPRRPLGRGLGSSVSPRSGSCRSRAPIGHGEDRDDQHDERGPPAEDRRQDARPAPGRRRRRVAPRCECTREDASVAARAGSSRTAATGGSGRSSSSAEAVAEAEQHERAHGRRHPGQRTRTRRQSTPPITTSFVRGNRSP